MSHYLGLDSSTQGLTAVVIDLDARRTVKIHNVNFDRRLPGYGTQNGVLPAADPRVAHSSPLLWAEALDLMFSDLAAEGIDLSRIRAIAGSGQQHGSVYLNDTAGKVLAGLEPARPLADQLGGIFARRTSPIWMDSSTTRECREITDALGGEEATARLTGSCAFERFTGPQIRKFHREDPQGYARTAKIHLVSSYMASLLAGADAPIDPGDGAGMNMMDIARKEWAEAALGATAPGLREKLPEARPSDTVVGTVHRYFAERYGLSGTARVVAWSGDNPNSLVGVGLVSSGKVAISLGTSDTYFGFMPEPNVDPRGEGHVFGSPTGAYMSLICFKNGSLAREKIRDRFGLDWGGFEDALGKTPPGNRGAVLLPYFDPEIVPRVLEPGVRRYGLQDGDSDGPANVRAVVEAQMMSMAIHSRWMGVQTTTIHATGGASASRGILRIMADVHDAEVYQFEVGNSAALGAALRAAHADLKAEGRERPWEETIAGFTDPVAGSRIAPDPKRAEMYREFMDVYRACEDHALRGGPDPERAQDRFRKKWSA